MIHPKLNHWIKREYRVWKNTKPSFNNIKRARTGLTL